MNILDEIRRMDKHNLKIVMLRRGPGNSIVEFQQWIDGTWTWAITRRDPDVDLHYTMILLTGDGNMSITHWFRPASYIPNLQHGLDKPLYDNPMRKYTIYNMGTNQFERGRKLKMRYTNIFLDDMGKLMSE